MNKAFTRETDSDSDADDDDVAALPPLQRLQRRLAHGLAQRLALLGRGLREHGDQCVLVDA